MSDDNTVDIQDFTIREKRIRFRIDDDLFEGYSTIGLHAMQDLVRQTKNISDAISSENYQVFTDIFDNLLVPDSAKRLKERIITNNRDDELDLKKQVLPVLYYLLEKHGLRPTQQSSD